MNKKVIIGMSGGVDSAVAAALLKKDGFEVIGVTLQMFNAEGPPPGGGSENTANDAKTVAGQLGIDHVTLDLRERFRRHVMDYLFDTYTAGKTPNPCVQCNKFVKFAALFDYADEVGANYVATGHYARVEYDGGMYLLKKSAHKDQTYVLYSLTQARLSRLLTPLGSKTKEEVRAIAEKLELKVAQKPDSQDICFIPDGDYVGFFERNYYYTAKPGRFIDGDGNFLGLHKGVTRYTLGQRKGLGDRRSAPGGFDSPMYVTKIDAESGDITLGEESGLFSSTLTAGNVNWISIEELTQPIEVTAKIRYAAKEAEATVYPQGENTARVEFKQPQRAITPGQSVVFYKGEVVAGGGVID